MKNYLGIWRQFNKFLIRLDVKPKSWEERVTLFIGFKIDQSMKSTTVKSYVSAIKKMLVDDGYVWDDQKILLASLTKACKVVNDKVRTRLPIQCGLLELILFEVNRIYGPKGQHYLQILYQTLFALAYYGMMRISEVTLSDHVLKARNVNAALNKDKLLLVLTSSKTHSQGMRPQKIKITSNINSKTEFYQHRNFCPFELVHTYMKLRGNYDSDKDQFFVFRDGTPVGPDHARSILRQSLSSLGLDPINYGMHSFRVGRTTDLIKCNYSLEEVKCMGRWRSNTVYKYIKL